MICNNCKTRNNYYHEYCYFCGAKLRKEKDDDSSKSNGLEKAQMPVIIVETGHIAQKVQEKAKVAKIRQVILVGAVGLLVLSIFFVLATLNSRRAQEAAEELLIYSSNYEELELTILDDFDGIEFAEDQCLLNVHSNAASIQVDGVEIDAVPNDQNQWALNVKLPNYGNNSIQIKAVGQSGETIRKYVDIYRKFPDLPIEFESGQLFTTDQEELVIRGNVPLNTTLRIITDLEYEVSHDAAFSDFVIKVSMPPIPGDYNLQIEAFAPEYETTMKSFLVRRELNDMYYMSAAVPLNYSSLMSGGYNFNDGILSFTGAIKEYPDDSDSGHYEFYIDNRAGQVVVVDYLGSEELNKGKVVSVYAEYVGLVDDMPKFVARVIR